MFDDLDRTIEQFLKNNLPTDLASRVAISFAAPDSEFPPSTVKLPAIDLFLYDVRENLEMRGAEWSLGPVSHANPVFKSTPGTVMRKPPPVQVECSYIITAWTSETTAGHTFEEHRLLGETLKALLRRRAFPDDVLQGCLKDGGVTVWRTLALQPDYLRMGEFWQAMGGTPRVAVNYQVTLSIDAREPTETALAGERKIDVQTKDG